MKTKNIDKIVIYPDDWIKYRLQDAVSYIDYGISKAIPKIQTSEGIKIVSTADITKDGHLLYDKIRRIEATEKQIQNLALKDGDVLFNWRNSAELIGKTTIFNEIEEISIFASFILRIRCDEEKTHNYFLKHLLNYFRYEGVFIQLSRRAVNQANYNRNEIYELPLHLPIHKEQAGIAKVLNSIEQAIEKQQALIDRTTELKKALMHKLFTEGAKGEAQKETEIGLVPESWEVVEIGDIFKLSSGKSRPKDISNKRTEDKNIPIFGGNGVLGYSSQIFIKNKVLVLGRVGEYCGCAHLTQGAAWISDNALYSKEIKRPINLIFIKECFDYLNLNQYSNKMGQPLITQGIIHKVKFGLPSETEQKEIAIVANRLNLKIFTLKQKKTILESLFKTMLHELMTGKIRVKDIEL